MSNKMLEGTYRYPKYNKGSMPETQDVLSGRIECYIIDIDHYNMTGEVRRIEEGSHMKQVNKFLANYPTKESLLAVLEKVSQSQLAIDNGMSPSVVTMAVKRLKISQEELEKARQIRKLAELNELNNKKTQENPNTVIMDNQEYEVEADNFVVVDSSEETHEFTTLDAALNHIKTSYNLVEIGQVKMFKEIPFVMNVQVSVR